MLTACADLHVVRARDTKGMLDRNFRFRIMVKKDWAYMELRTTGIFRVPNRVYLVARVMCPVEMG
jgi:hypothetical protein